MIAAKVSLLSLLMIEKVQPVNLYCFLLLQYRLILAPSREDMLDTLQSFKGQTGHMERSWWVWSVTWFSEPGRIIGLGIKHRLIQFFHEKKYQLIQFFRRKQWYQRRVRGERSFLNSSYNSGRGRKIGIFTKTRSSEEKGVPW
eukprot:TRINITY_DN8498_c0_g1_i17.p1 TRINITY_DN8498_c0_g1~~TRINITY_DN8498_c0_g1_i17.p1  ORF type:complete len:143 (+),score=25.85 TRINITY_DN8498_c0_g1_i17:612-1040(+)